MEVLVFQQESQGISLHNSAAMFSAMQEESAFYEVRWKVSKAFSHRTAIGVTFLLNRNHNFFLILVIDCINECSLCNGTLGCLKSSYKAQLVDSGCCRLGNA